MQDEKYGAHAIDEKGLASAAAHTRATATTAVISAAPISSDPGEAIILDFSDAPRISLAVKLRAALQKYRTQLVRLVLPAGQLDTNTLTVLEQTDAKDYPHWETADFSYSGETFPLNHRDSVRLINIVMRGGFVEVNLTNSLVLNERGIAKLLEFVNHAVMMRRLILRGIALDCRGESFLVGAFRDFGHYQYLSHVDMSDNNFDGDSTQLFISLLQLPALSVLNMDGVNLHPSAEELIKVARALKRNKNLSKLSIARCHLDDEDLQLLMGAMAAHPRLASVSCDDNAPGKKAAQAFAKLLKPNPTKEFAKISMVGCSAQTFTLADLSDGIVTSDGPGKKLLAFNSTDLMTQNIMRANSLTYLDVRGNCSQSDTVFFIQLIEKDRSLVCLAFSADLKYLPEIGLALEKNKTLTALHLDQPQKYLHLLQLKKIPENWAMPTVRQEVIFLVLLVVLVFLKPTFNFLSQCMGEFSKLLNYIGGGVSAVDAEHARRILASHPFLTDYKEDEYRYYPHAIYPVSFEMLALTLSFYFSYSYSNTQFHLGLAFLFYGIIKVIGSFLHQSPRQQQNSWQDSSNRRLIELNGVVAKGARKVFQDHKREVDCKDCKAYEAEYLTHNPLPAGDYGLQKFLDHNYDVIKQLLDLNVARMAMLIAFVRANAESPFRYSILALIPRIRDLIFAKPGQMTQGHMDQTFARTTSQRIFSRDIQIRPGDEEQNMRAIPRL